MNKNDGLKKAVDKLEIALKEEKDEFTRDSAIKRFELCFDLAWKSIQQNIREKGLDCYSPRECFKLAFETRLIEYDEVWLEMVQKRNEAVHIYNENLAEDLYKKLPAYLLKFKDLASNL